MVTAQDMQNNLNLGIEKTDAQQPNPNQKPLQQNAGIQKNATLKVTDIQQRIIDLNNQKKLVNQEIINLQGAQRDLMPNNPNDPQNTQKQKVFSQDQQEKIKIQQQKLKVLEDEIKNLQSEISRNKQNYL
jgi:hypothetical protein